MDKQTMRGFIDKLLVIQEKDCRMARCLRELSDIPNLKKNVQARLDQHKQALAKSKDAVKTCLAAIKEGEIEIDVQRQKVAKLRDQQFQIKSNEEFKALNKEIDALLEQIRGLEDREIELMEAAEQAQQEERARQAELARSEESVRSDLQQMDDRGKTLDSEVKDLQGERQGLVSGLPEDVLSLYNRVMENRKDIALVSVEKNSCGGCHMKLPPHVIQDIKRADSLITCSFCGRLLYYHF